MAGVMDPNALQYRMKMQAKFFGLKEKIPKENSGDPKSGELA